ncbi:araE [Symbiodinium natans]|uniref:Hexose transporter 1 n=1 Tax=Symbiodinium natans TaxID=878477 RepID=A0A812S2F1_9DINO|nr:araE [Symbiodinium natans]
MVTAFPLVSGFFLDALGRKVSLMIGSLIFLLGSVIQATCSSVAVMIVGRFVAGCSIGILSTVVPLYQSELAPPHLRGGLTAIAQVMVVLGVAVAAFADALLLPLADGWRWAILLPVLPGLVLFVGMFFLPRSPRWLVQHGQEDAALRVLLSIRDEAEARSELQEIVLDQQRARASGPHLRWSELCSGRNARLLAVGVTLQLLQQLTGINVFVSFGPRIFISLGLDSASLQTALMWTLFVATLPVPWGRHEP